MPFSKLRDIILNDRRFYIGFGVIFILLILGFISGCIFQHQIKLLNTMDPALRFHRIHLIVILIGGIAFLIFTGWFHQKYNWKVPEEIIHQLQEITEIDAKSLSNVMSELSQGNLSTSIQIHASPLEEKDLDNNGQYLNILNHIIEGLHASARELNILTDIPCHRLCYVGADSYLEGRKCGETMGTLLDGHGEVIVIIGLFSATHFELRRKGFENTIRLQFPRIKIVDVYEDHENPDVTYQCTVGAMEKYPHLRGVYVTHGGSPFSVARAVQDKQKENQIKIVSHDLTDSTMTYMTKGLISATLGQNPYAQGYNPVILLFNYLVGKWKPFAHRLLTKMDVVTPENYQMYWHPEQGIIQSNEALSQLVKPSDTISEKPLRIAVMCVENSAFWIPVKTGVMHAREKLSACNVTVDWISPSQDVNLPESDLFCETLKSIINQKYDGIATIVMYRNMIPIINEAVNKGIPVITFNSEPISLQGLIRAISEQATKLQIFSQTLTNSTNEANSLTQQIKKAMNSISEGTAQQNNQVAHTQNILQTLLNNINQVNRATDEGNKTTATTAKAITEGAQSMEKTLNMIKSIENGVTKAWHTVEALGEHSEQIDTVIELIQDITSRVNVLAMNASIEATQAKEQGQGFMVVANQVRRLAHNAANTAQEVTTLISQVKKDINQIEEVMNTGLREVQKSAEQTNKAQQVLFEIQSMIEMDQNRLKNITDAIAEIQTYSYRVDEAMNKVTEVSEINTKSIQHVDASTQDMIVQLQQVNQMTSILEMMAQSELELLGKFNISAGSHMNKEKVELKQ